MNVAAPDGVKIYNLSSGKTLPAWLSDKKKKALRKDAEFQKRIELLYGADFPAASQRIKCSKDGRYLDGRLSAAGEGL